MWNHLDPATCLPDHCFCEAIRDGAIRQPANTWSSLAFSVAALFMLREWAKRRDSRGLTSLEGVLLLLAVFLVGVTSAFYHASLSFLGQWLDVQSMYLLVLLAFAVNVDALRPGKPKRSIALYVGLNLGLGVLLVLVPALRRYAFAVVLLSIIGTEVVLRQKKLRDWPLAPLVGAGAVQGTAFIIWILDLTHTVCAPHSLVQGHAAWHTLGAVASWLLWRYFRGPEAETVKTAALAA